MRSFMVLVGVLAAVMGVTARDVHGQGNSRAAESFVLSGVISVEGGGGLAWLQEPTLTNNQVRAVRRGDSIGAYRLTEIFEDRVELEGPAGKIFVPLYSAQAAPGPQTAAAPAPTPPAVANLQQLLNQAAQQPAAAPATPPPAAADLQQLLNQSAAAPATLPPTAADLRQLLNQPAAAPATLPPAAADLRQLLNQSSQQPSVRAQPQQPELPEGQAAVPQPSAPAMSTQNASASGNGMLHQPGSPRQLGLGALLEALGHR
jgi:hypothetical protein